VRRIIVPTRLASSSKAYEAIWTKEGSPLLVYGEKVKTKLQAHLGVNYRVELAMRYQQPTIESGLAKLLKDKIGHLVILPLFPQYASATTGSVHQRVMELLKDQTILPRVTLIDRYATHPALIQAFCKIAEPYKAYDHVLFSFHGLPLSQLKHGAKSGQCCEDPYCYSGQCYAMAREIRQGLRLPEEKCSLAFQSRLGKDPWLEPYTSDTIRALAREGKKRVLVFSPSFVCDCLETIYEIGIEYQTEFVHAGGEKLELVPGLNDHDAWIHTLGALIKES